MRIPYSSRSQFLSACKSALSTHTDQLVSGVKIELEPGGYEASIQITIDLKNPADFEAGWQGTDITRFPARIKAAATALFDLSLGGTFEIAHRSGHLFIQRQGEPKEESWSREELKAAVQVYVELLHKHHNKERVVKSHYYRDLAKRFGRSPKAFEYRLQNISAVYAQMGRQWVPGLKPAQHIGWQVVATIQELIAEVEGEIGVVSVPRPKPRGVRHPRLSLVMVKQYSRSTAVQEWVLAQAKGCCECCEGPAPFTTETGEPFLEVHHVRPLAQGGTDTPKNTVALCPNCHRELHYGALAPTLKDALYQKVARLTKE